MLGVPDESLPLRIDHPIHQFQGDLADQDRVVIGNRSQFRNGQRIQPKEVSVGVSKTGGEK